MSKAMDQLGGLPMFDGPAYDAKADKARLGAQIRRVLQTMLVGDWLTLAEIHERTHDPEASISAQLRHLRKARFGGHTIERRRRGEASGGLWEYRLGV